MEQIVIESCAIIRNTVQILPTTSRSSTSQVSTAGLKTGPRWSDAPSNCLASPPTPCFHSGPAFQTSVSASTKSAGSRKPFRVRILLSPVFTMVLFGPIVTPPPVR